VGVTVIDVNEASFQAEVIDRSHREPVVVDFWAEWCGPCRALGPLLERAAASREGKVTLAKLDTDANPSLAQAFGIQGIPAVKALRDGKVVDEFVGVKPPAEVERFFDALVPSEADALVDAGDEPSLRAAVALEPGRADAAVPLARLLHARGETDAALELLEPVNGSFGADGLRARIALERAAQLDGDGAPPAAVLDGLRALDEGDEQRGLDLLIDALAQSDGFRDDVRQVIVGELERLGVEHPLARDARRRLAAALY
jgi:putative thioredoxin